MVLLRLIDSIGPSKNTHNACWTRISACHDRQGSRFRWRLVTIVGLCLFGECVSETPKLSAPSTIRKNDG